MLDFRGLVDNGALSVKCKSLGGLQACENIKQRLGDTALSQRGHTVTRVFCVCRQSGNGIGFHDIGGLPWGGIFRGREAQKTNYISRNKAAPLITSSAQRRRYQRKEASPRLFKHSACLPDRGASDGENRGCLKGNTLKCLSESLYLLVSTLVLFS